MSLIDACQQHCVRGSSITKLQPGQNPAPFGSQHGLSQALGIPEVVQRSISYPLSSAARLINAPQRLTPGLLQPFVQQRKHLLLSHPALGRVPALLTSFSDQTLSVAVRRSPSFLPYTRQLLLVHFPVLPEESYLLPTRIETIQYGRLTLTYQEPRSGPRWRIPAPVTFSCSKLQADLLSCFVARRPLHLTRTPCLLPAPGRQQPTQASGGDRARNIAGRSLQHGPSLSLLSAVWRRPRWRFVDCRQEERTRHFCRGSTASPV
jgi:hypothetical protein